MSRCLRAARCGLRNKGKRGLLRLRPCWGGGSLQLWASTAALARVHGARVAHRFARTSGLYASSPHQCTPCCVKRVHERHESPFFDQILTLVYTFWVPLGHFRSAARPMRPLHIAARPMRAHPWRAPCDRTSLESLLHRARAPCAPKEWLARAHHIDDVLTTLPLALHCIRNAHAFRSRALRWHNALSPYCDDVPAARGSRRGDIGGGLEVAPFRLTQCGG